MAYEIELKVSLEDKDFVLETLTKRGCNWEKSKKQYDKIYYKKDYTDFNSRKDIFLRIRYEDNNNILTFKQILNDLEVIEFESLIGNPSEIAKMMPFLGFEEYVSISKIRMEGKLNNLSICLDEVDELGYFLEVEKIVEESKERDKTKKELQNFLLSLEINLDQICHKRYHTMLYELHDKGRK